MSFLSDLLNPAPSSSSDPRTSSHSPPARHLAHIDTRREHDYRRGSVGYSAPASGVTSYEAGSALTALATGDAGAYSPQTSTTARFASPTLPSHPLPPLALPPPNGTARRSSFAQPYTGLGSSSAHTLPSPTSDLEQYRSSRSPDELRRQSYPVFEHSQSHLDGVAPGGPIKLAPLRADRGAPSTAKNASATSSSARIDEQEEYQTQSHHTRAVVTPPLPLDSRAHTKGRMEEEAVAMVVEQPAPSQIREPSAAAPEAVMTPQAPEPAERKPLPTEPSPDARIKDEPLGTPMEGTPVKDPSLRRGSTQGAERMDENTLKAIEAAKNDFGLRGARQKAQPSIEEPPPPAATEESKNKKRPAPKVKKGQATVKKPPSKKRRVDESASDARLSAAQRATGGGKKSKSNTPALGSSPAPGSAVSGDNESAYASDASSDDNEVFCICRRGDNHTWMIACDGGCEDWFHGKCVNILEEDGELIDKYICPNCEKTSGKVTTWLPGCRNLTCRKPARIRKGNMSKYCSDKCGKEFMDAQVRRSEETRRLGAGGREKATKPKRRGITMAEINGDAGDSDEDLGPRGGALKASELKALTTSVDGDVTAFRSLGAGVLSPPATVSPTADRFPTDDEHLTAAEKARIEGIGKEKDDLRRRRALLKDREKFGQLVRENVARYAEREKVKPKDVCGYDNRLTWSEEEFRLWRESDEGQATLSSGVLELPEPKDPSKPEVNGSAEHMDVDEESNRELEKKATMCTKKRCERHRQWQKQALADVRFEESTLADQMRALEKEERETKEMGVLRGRMELGGLNGEGTVEVVGATATAAAV